MGATAGGWEEQFENWLLWSLEWLLQNEKPEKNNIIYTDTYT